MSGEATSWELRSSRFDFEHSSEAQRLLRSKDAQEHARERF
jgi:hypothetical protein